MSYTFYGKRRTMTPVSNRAKAVSYRHVPYRQIDLDKTVINEIFENYKPQVVVNLAAQAGVRYSITNPDTYIQSNLIGFYNILEACRHSYDGGAVGVEHLV